MSASMMSMMGVALATGGGGGGAFITPSVEFADGALPGGQTAETVMGAGGDYIICRGNSGTPVRGGSSSFGPAIGLLTGPTDTNIDTGTRLEIDDSGSGHLDGINFTQPAGESGAASATLSAYGPASLGVAMKRDFVAPATAGQQNTVRVSFCHRRYEWGNSSSPIGLSLVLTLSDGSVSPVIYNLSGTVGDYGFYGAQIKVDYKPNSTGTLLISCRELSSMISHQGEGGYHFGVHSIIFTPNT